MVAAPLKSKAGPYRNLTESQKAVLLGGSADECVPQLIIGAGLRRFGATRSIEAAYVEIMLVRRLCVRGHRPATQPLNLESEVSKADILLHVRGADANPFIARVLLARIHAHQHPRAAIRVEDIFYRGKRPRPGFEIENIILASLHVAHRDLSSLEVWR